MTAGSVEPLRLLHDDWGGRVHMLDVLIRQAHPGPGARAYTTLQQKIDDARRFKRDEAVPYPVLVDDLRGTTHQVYGGLADPTYVIGTDGRVSFYSLWTHAPTLHRALEALLAQGGRGIVLGGLDRAPHAGSVVTDGWKGLRRGLPQSALELELSAPGMATLPFLGYQFRPLLAPLTLRSQPLPPTVKLLLAGAVAGAVAFGVRRWRRATRS